MTFGQRLKRLRLRVGLTPAELAEASGLSSTLLYGYERDAIRPRLDSAQKIARALRCSVDKLADTGRATI